MAKDTLELLILQYPSVGITGMSYYVILLLNSIFKLAILELYIIPVTGHCLPVSLEALKARWATNPFIYSQVYTTVLSKTEHIQMKPEVI